jgi:16S rRNA (cytosine1407-C5)-methyltransferase
MNVEADKIGNVEDIFPEGYLGFLADNAGQALAEGAAVAYVQPGETALRLNRAKLAKASAEVAVALSVEQGFKHRDIPYSPEGIGLARRPSFIHDPAWHAGGYYVQEAASQVAAQLLAAHLVSTDSMVLDLCAAPGGKATHLAAICDALGRNGGDGKESGSGVLVIANEVNKGRTGRLAENLERWGAAGVATISAEAAMIGSRMMGAIDAVLCDAPCSGEGLFRKDAAAREEWSVQAVAMCANRQRRIVADIWPALRPGGILVYSTCTLNADENERIVAYMCRELGARVLPLPFTLAAQAAGYHAGVIPIEGGPGEGEALRFLPSAFGGEGFFCCALQKGGTDWDGLPDLNRTARERLHKPGKASLAYAGRLIAEEARFFEHNKAIRYLPAGCEMAALRLLDALPVQQLGMEVSTLKTGGQADMISPSHALAYGLHTAGKGSIWNDFALSYHDGLRYLYKQLPHTLPEPGFYRATYGGLGLGWLKVIGPARANSSLPANRRVLTELNGEGWSLV